MFACPTTTSVESSKRLYPAEISIRDTAFTVCLLGYGRVNCASIGWLETVIGRGSRASKRCALPPKCGM